MQVRHRLNDDWAFGNDVDSRPWDFQAEECALRSAVDRFNNRRYDRGVGGQERKEVLEGEFEPVDNCVNSVLGQVSIKVLFLIHHNVITVGCRINGRIQG